MAAKLLEKRFGIKDVSCSSAGTFTICHTYKVKEWLKMNDSDHDGRLSYMEFKKSLKKFLNLNNDEQNGGEKE